MSILVSDEFDFYRLRTSYLTAIKDGPGERLIAVNTAIVNNHGFRTAGWDSSQTDPKRAHSPDIPTAIAAEYFQAPPRSAGLPPVGFGEDEEEGGMVTGAGLGDTVAPGISSRRRRRREHEDQDSSDLSDESDEDVDTTQRAAQQIKFSKMPVRNRAGSSPIRQSNRDNGPSVLVTSPSRPPEESRLRRGSLGAIETIKERARRDTATSSDMSSENEFGPSHFRRRRVDSNPSAKTSKAFASQLEYRENRIPVEMDDEDSGDSDSTSLSSDFAHTPESASLLDSLTGQSSLGRLPIPGTQQSSPKKSRLQQSTLSALPPPRPISMIAPKSALSEAINKSRNKKASPLETFGALSATAVDLKPLNLKIYVPSSKDPEKGIDVLIRRTIQNQEESNTINLGKNPERDVTVYDVIGLSLWRYIQDKLEPKLGEKEDETNPNRWLLLMAEDGEPDEDLVLERTKAIVSFASNNNQRAARGARARGKAYDEFALVKATDEQFKENERMTPNVSQKSEVEELETAQKSTQPKKPDANPHLTFQEKLWKEFGTPVDVPQPSTHATPRMGAPKILRIHLHALDPFAQSISVDVSTDTYLAEVLEIVCKKRNLDKAQCVLKVRGTNIVVPLDRTVEALGEINELDLFRRRFADGLDTITGSPGSTSPNAPLIIAQRKGKAGKQTMHPLADVQASTGYKKYLVIRRNQASAIFANQERTLAIDGEWIHIMPNEAGGTTVWGVGGGSGKTTSIHFSTVIGCKVKRSHPKQFKLVMLKSEREHKKYDFEAANREEASEIVEEITKAVQMHTEQVQARRQAEREEERRRLEQEEEQRRLEVEAEQRRLEAEQRQREEAEELEPRLFHNILRLVNENIAAAHEAGAISFSVASFTLVREPSNRTM